MAKLIKYFFSLAMIPVLLTTIFISSCSSELKVVAMPLRKDNSNLYKAINFINSKTVTITAELKTQFISGTAWVIKKESNFDYWFVTNAHVVQVDNQHNWPYNSNIYLSWTDDISAPQKISLTTNSKIKNSIKQIIQPVDNETKLDLALIKLDLSSIQSKIPQSWNTNLTINDFVNDRNQTNEQQKDFYIAGYPIGKSQNSVYTYLNYMQFESINEIFPSSLSKGLLGSGLTAVLNHSKLKTKFTLTGGASGSMVLERVGTEFKIAGIYWGYFSDSINSNNNALWKCGFDIFYANNYQYGENSYTYNLIPIYYAQ